MQKNKSAFTFVELIVVLVIIAILSTIGFVSYEAYLGAGRDTAKISLVRDMHTSFGTYSLQSRIPLPDNKVGITASGSIFAYQGDFTEEIANTIGFKGNPYDKSLDIYPSYMLLSSRKDVQILHYLEDPQSIQTAFIGNTYAFTDYQQLFPKVTGKALGILIESNSQEPLHLLNTVLASGSYDVINGTGSLRAYYSQDEYYEDNISRIIPDKSCKRILELGGSKGSGVYTINPTGTSKVRVYCDMQTDGGGWTLVGRGREDWGWNNDGKNIEKLGISPGKPGAFEPAYLSSNIIDQILGGIDILDLQDGVRIRRASDTKGTEYQEVRWKFTSQENWSWLFDNSLALSDTMIDGISLGNGNTRDDYNGGGDERRVFTWAWSSHGGKKGFSYGSTIIEGDSQNSNYLWENGTEGHAIPYSEVYIRN